MKSLTQLISTLNYNKSVAFILSLSLIFNPLALQAQSVNSSEDVDNKKVIAAKTADLEFYSLSNEELVKKIEEYLKELNELDKLVESGELTQEEADILRDSLLTKVNNGSRIAGGLGILALVGLLAGGSDGDSDSAPVAPPPTPPTQTNTAPSITSSSSFNINEGLTSVGNITATDSDSNILIFSISGDDASSFVLTNSAEKSVNLSFVNSPDFETKSSYSINVRVSDGSLSDSQDLTVSINDINDESPIFTSLSSFSVNENQTAVGSIAATDADAGDSILYTITGGADSDSFKITSENGLLEFKTASDFETQSSFSLEITATDTADNFTKQNVSVNIIDLNDNNPVFTSSDSFSVAEGTDAVATLTGLDADGDSVSFSSTLAGDDAADFTLSSSGALAFAATPNFEAPADANTNNIYSITATITDGTNTSTQAITITVTDTNDEAPVLSVSSPYSVAENITTVGTVTAADADAGSTITYTLTGADAAKFDINSASGAISFVSAPDFEAPGSGDSSNAYSLNVVASDGTNSDTEALVVNVTDTNDNSPIFTSASSFTVAENQTAVGSLTATDADALEAITYAITGGADASSFTVTGSTLAFASAPNYEAQQSYVVVVTASDTNATNTTTQEITVNLTNVNDIAPVFTSADAFSVAEGTDAVATLTGSDAEGDSVSFSTTITGTDAADFTLSSSGALAFAATPNFEAPADANTNNVYSITATITDGTNTSTQAITVTVTDINDNSPVLSVSTPYSVAENTTSVGTVTAADADANSTITYTLSGTDAADFAINSSTGAITFAAIPNFEAPADADTNNAYSLNVIASDGTNSDTEALVVNVTDTNDESPVFTSASSFTVAENQTAVGSLAATDADANSTITFTKTGGADKDAFTVTGSTLAFASAPDFEKQQSYVVVVTASDGSNTTTQEITVNLTNVNDIAPVFTSADAFSVAEGTDAVATLTGLDADGTTPTFSTTLAGDDAADFTLSSSGALAFAATPNFEAPADNGTNNVYNITATITDGTNTSNQAITITVTDTNDNSPVLSVATPYSVAENTTTVGTVTAADADANSTITYTLTGTDAAKFDINSASGAISFVSAPDFEAPGSAANSNAYSLNVVASDGTNTDTEALVVNVTGTNDESPVFTSSASISVNENQTTIGNITATDADANSDLVYSISGGADANDFAITSIGFFTFANAPDFEQKTSYEVEVSVTDGVNITTQNITVNINNISDVAPVFTSTPTFTVQEGVSAVGNIQATDVENESITFTLGGDDAADFELTSIGALTFATTPNFEAPADSNTDNIYNILVTATDTTNTRVQAVTVTVTDINDEAPVLTVNTPYSVAENTTSVGTVTAADADANSTITYTLSWYLMQLNLILIVLVVPLVLFQPQTLKLQAVEIAAMLTH
jgi:transcription elongation GreA/GreB family factor